MPNPEPLTVLIADDNVPITEMLRELVTQPGRIEVVGAVATETTAIESIRAMRPDVVLLDLQLASGTGTDVIRAVRADPALRRVRLAVLSNHASPEIRSGCLKLGADDYFDKTLQLGELAARLDQLAALKQQ